VHGEKEEVPGQKMGLLLSGFRGLECFAICFYIVLSEKQIGSNGLCEQVFLFSQVEDIGGRSSLTDYQLHTTSCELELHRQV